MTIQDQIFPKAVLSNALKYALGFMLTAMLTGEASAQNDSSDKGEIPEQGQLDTYPVASGLPIDAIPDLQNTKSKRKIFGKSLIIVPIPMSSPTFGTGLILGGAYFHSQTEEEKKTQPASFTGAAAGYTSNKKSAFGGVVQQNYWGGDTWRFTGTGGAMDFSFNLRPPTDDGKQDELDWNISGYFFQASLMRRIKGNWYAGGYLRYLDVDQGLRLNTPPGDFSDASSITAPGVGLNLDYDSRDVPTNAYKGRFLALKAMFNEQTQQGGKAYQGYSARFRSYHQVLDKLVLALDVNACARTGSIPLWDTCRVPLRGYSGTDYLGKKSAWAQVEARRQLSKRWGLVGFAGAGKLTEKFTSLTDDSVIPSYGVGIRFMALESQRINIRVDYARSNDSDAWYLSVGEAF
jgi:hypothetical protein